MIRHLRVPELAFWTGAVLLLGGALAAATVIGQGEEPHAPGLNVTAIPSATRSASRIYVEHVIALMPAGTAAGVDPSAVTAWARSIGSEAASGAQVRAAEGAGEDDALFKDFARLQAQAAAVETSVADKVAVTALRTQIGLTAEHATALINGLPAPELPAGSLDPLGSNGAEPQTPNPANPDQPNMPTIPKENA